MTESANTVSITERAQLQAEIVRLNKIVAALINRAERDMGGKGSAFSMFRSAITLENQIRERTKALEAALHENERINRALQREKEEQRALIRELEDAHNQLVQSEKLASIGQLAAGVAHEINNPIGFVNSNLGTLKRYVAQLLGLIDDFSATVAPLLTKEPLVEQQVEDLKQAVELDFLREDVCSLIDESIEGTSRVRQIVQDLRDFSRTGAVDIESVDLHAGLESTLNVVGNEIRYKAEVDRQYGVLPQIECRPAQINQVFMNMLVNAAQSIPGKGKITIRSGRLDSQVWISISDTGTGIAPENLARIFDPFFTTKAIGKGTGLGLSVSYGIIEKHGGRIEVASRPGEGTSFTIWLPISQTATGTE